MLAPRRWLDRVVLLPLHTVAGVLSPQGSHGRFSVLIYHRVLPCFDPLLPTEPDVKSFRWQMALLQKYFNVLPLAEATERLAAGTLPSRAVSITFDDGYADNVNVALPILRQFGLPATFFIASGYLDGGRMWNDTVIEAVRRAHGPMLDLRRLGLDCLPIATSEQRREAIKQLLSRLKHLPQEQRAHQASAIADIVGTDLPDDLMMRSEQVRALAAADMKIGAHTVTHPILSTISEAQARKEIETSRDQLREITGKAIELFAYPNGKPGRDYGSQHVELVRALGFRAAFSTAWGAARRSTDLFELPRFTPWDQTPTRFFARLLQNYLRAAPPAASPRAPETTAQAS